MEKIYIISTKLLCKLNMVELIGLYDNNITNKVKMNKQNKYQVFMVNVRMIHQYKWVPVDYQNTFCFFKRDWLAYVRNCDVSNKYVVFMEYNSIS